MVCVCTAFDAIWMWRYKFGNTFIYITYINTYLIWKVLKYIYSQEIFILFYLYSNRSCFKCMCTIRDCELFKIRNFVYASIGLFEL